jgi:hypothetical protein
LNFVRKGLEGAALVGSGKEPVFLKLDDWLEVEVSGGDLQLEDPDEVSGGGLGEVDDDRLRGDRSVDLLTDSFSEGGVGKTLF